LLVWVSVETGVALHLRWRPGGTAMTWMLELHRIASTLALAFIVGHVWGLLIDPVVRFEPWEAALPLLGPYRPLQAALGAMALWLIAAVLITTALADKLPYAVWRRSHYLAFPAYAFSLLHGLTSGTDSGTALALAFYAGTASMVAATLVWRLAGRGWTTAAEREF
jgi:sulfoxide reductase heme-binding subunit YedZ